VLWCECDQARGFDDANKQLTYLICSILSGHNTFTGTCTSRLWPVIDDVVIIIVNGTELWTVEEATEPALPNMTRDDGLTT